MQGPAAQFAAPFGQRLIGVKGEAKTPGRRGRNHHRRVRHPAQHRTVMVSADDQADLGMFRDDASEALGVSEGARRYHEQLLQAFEDPASADPDDREGAGNAATFKRFWNYATPWNEAMKRHGSGTVGAVVRAADGHFAVATSTGGSAPSLLGRVGDTPVIGCGYYAGEHGAVAATGVGEYIARQMLARTVYDWVAQGMPLQQALEQGVARLPKEVSVGLIGVTRDEAGASSNRDMAFHVLR